MKTFNKSAAQGDVMFFKVENIPDSAAEQKATDGKIVITHSETGHDHIMVLDRVDESPNVQMFAGDNPLVAWIKVNRPTVLEHKRPHDTHEPILFSPGVYEVRRQREYTPEGWRRVED